MHPRYELEVSQLQSKHFYKDNFIIKSPMVSKTKSNSIRWKRVKNPRRFYLITESADPQIQEQAVCVIMPNSAFRHYAILKAPD